MPDYAKAERYLLAAQLDLIFKRYGDTPACRELLAYEVEQAAKRYRDAKEA